MESDFSTRTFTFLHQPFYFHGKNNGIEIDWC
jgi:hypothetical protein